MENLEQTQSGHDLPQNEILETDLENSELKNEIDLEQEEPQPYTEMNLELESFLNDATTTQEELRQHSRDEKAKIKEQELLEAKAYTPEKAAGMAVQFIAEAINFTREQTGKDIQPTASQMKIGAALFTPVIMKYGAAVENAIANSVKNVDGDSNLPEYLAAGGLLGMVGLLWKKARSAPPIPKDVPQG